jgi:hypothetical protein
MMLGEESPASCERYDFTRGQNRSLPLICRAAYSLGAAGDDGTGGGPLLALGSVIRAQDTSGMTSSLFGFSRAIVTQERIYFR